MFVENVPTIVNIKMLKGQFIPHKFFGWAVGVVKAVDKKKSVAGQFVIKYKSETHWWAQKQNREDLKLFRLNNLLLVHINS